MDDRPQGAHAQLCVAGTDAKFPEVFDQEDSTDFWQQRELLLRLSHTLPALI